MNCLSITLPKFERLSEQVKSLLFIWKDTRNGRISWSDAIDGQEFVTHDDGLLEQIRSLSRIFSSADLVQDAAALHDAYELATSSTDFGGLGLHPQAILSEQDTSEVLFLVSAHLEALNSAERAKAPMAPFLQRPSGRRAMTLSEKIFAAHDVDRRGEVQPGDVIRVDVDWIMASELSWKGMERWYDKLGQPGIYRNDRFWLAGDHLVDPRVIDTAKIKPFVASAELAKRNFKMTENQGMNYTIMHTEFCRERAQPGMLVIGSDSHTCSAGSMSCLGIGLGYADVILPLITGETWFKIPETIQVRFINKPKPGISGKDIILYVLKELKRNTVASDRVVEYTGPGIQYLSCDARFAIANMTTEFGGVTGIFVPDAITDSFIQRRKKSKYRSNAIYFRPDADAVYAETCTIDLSQVESFVARYPKPDDVVPVTEMEGLELHGCFIGACTTAEEDLVLAALVLEEGMKRGMKASRTKPGKRKVVPGSMPILHNLKVHGLCDIYEEAGWDIGVPGCSYCVGMSADQAERGETWLTSQNRNFENRMGPGAFGNLASAVTVAASSFEMKITDPASLLDSIDMDRVNRILGRTNKDVASAAPQYVEPGANARMNEAVVMLETQKGSLSPHPRAFNSDDSTHAITPSTAAPMSPELTLLSGKSSSAVISGKVALLGDFIDTDALAPNEAISKPNITQEELGTYCLCHTHPDFRHKVKHLGQNVVVAGEAFGCGSSREDAVGALQGAGVQCVIAKSFAFIYGRNQPNLGLLGFEMRNPRFWQVVADGRDISVDLDRSVLRLAVDDEGSFETFQFQLSPMQRRLMECGGAAKAFGKWGKGLWEALTSKAPGHGIDGYDSRTDSQTIERDEEKVKLEW